MTTATATEPARLTAELCQQIAALSRESKEQLIIWLQEELDGGPFLRDLPEQPVEPNEDVCAAWKSTIARRIEEMQTGKVEAIDAQGSATRLLQKMIRKYGS